MSSKNKSFARILQIPKTAWRAIWPEHRLPILAGFLIGTSYIPFPSWALFFCLTPLLIYWSRSQNEGRSFAAGWITQFILNIIGFHWIAYTAVEFGHFPWWFGVITLIAFAAIAHLHFAAAGWVGCYFAKRFRLGIGSSILFHATLFALFERFSPMIFPWHLGYPWIWMKLPGYQLADLIGFEGLNYTTIAANALLAWALSLGLFRNSAKNQARKAKLVLAAGVVLIVAVNLLGLGRAEKWSSPDSELKVLAIQGNIGNFEKEMAEQGSRFGVPILQKYFHLTREGLRQNPGSQLVLWPETAFPDIFEPPYGNRELPSRLKEFARRERVPIMTGAYSRDEDRGGSYNALAFIDGDGVPLLPPYRKSILLVFGETFPFADTIPYMDILFPGLGGFNKGPGPTPMTISLSEPAGQRVSIGPQICYEGLYPWFSNGLAEKGAEVFVNVTNDSWFGRPFEPYQHLYMTLARAIEFRRPLVRSTNTGITTTILADGTLLESSPLHEEWTGQFKVRYQSAPPATSYQKIGWLWPWVLVFGLVCLLIFGRVKER